MSRSKGWWPDRMEEDLEAVEKRIITIDEQARDDWTGLYDASGNMLYRERQPFGFRRK